MVTIENIVYSVLTSNAELFALVLDRIYHQFIPAGQQRPFVVFFLISKTPVQTQDGYDKLIRGIVQINSYSAQMTEALQIADVIKRQFAGIVIVMPSVRISTLVSSEINDYDDELHLFVVKTTVQMLVEDKT